MAPQPAKYLPLKLRLRFWPKYWQQLMNILWTGVFVLFGMLASLWFRCFIPNATGAVKLRRQLHDMTTRLRGSADDLPSQPRTVLESTIESCYSGLKKFPKFLPGFSTALTEVQANVIMCSSWVDTAYGVANVLGEARRLLQLGLPPTLMYLIEDRCDHALRPFLSGFTKPEESQAMSEALKDAQKYLDAGSQNTPVPELEAMIKEREDRVRPALQSLGQDYPSHAQLFGQLQNLMQQTLSPQIYKDLDTFSLKTELLWKYRDLARRYGATTFPPTAPNTPPGPQTALERMAARYEDFLSFVNAESYESLNMARIYMAEMEQDVYPAALIKELAKDPPAVEIHTAPSPVEPGVPVHYSLRFNRDSLNQKAAVHEWALRWKFQNESGAVTTTTVPPSQVARSAGQTAAPAVQPALTVSGPAAGVTETETGWDIYHRFPEKGTHSVSVTLVAFDGAVVPSSGPIQTEVVMKENDEREHRGVWWKPWTWTPEAKIEGLRVAFVLVIALAGVFVTARQKVEETGLFQGVAALIGLGFAADIVKNALSDKPGDK
jgi:hypothetical protein